MTAKRGWWRGSRRDSDTVGGLPRAPEWAACLRWLTIGEYVGAIAAPVRPLGVRHILPSFMTYATQQIADVFAGNLLSGRKNPSLKCNFAWQAGMAYAMLAGLRAIGHRIGAVGIVRRRWEDTHLPRCGGLRAWR